MQTVDLFDSRARVTLHASQYARPPANFIAFDAKYASIERAITHDQRRRHYTVVTFTFKEGWTPFISNKVTLPVKHRAI